jgi:hemoglobin
MKIEEVSEDAIRRLVDAFYAKIRADSVLGPIFERAIPGDWAGHLETMRAFWSSVMLTTGRYKGNPLAAHLRIEALTPQLFDQWLRLFDEACEDLFEDKVSEAFRTKAARIAESLKLGLFYRPERTKPTSALLGDHGTRREPGAASRGK